jgi:Cu/Ag efflux protein CusF
MSAPPHNSDENPSFIDHKKVAACQPRFLHVWEPGEPGGTNTAAATYRAYLTDRETAMKIAKILATTAAFITIGSAAWAQQALMGTITGINRLNDTVAIKQAQNGTVGANTTAGAEEFKVQKGLSLEDLHAGDKVSFSVTGTGETRTITKLQRQ